MILGIWNEISLLWLAKHLLHSWYIGRRTFIYRPSSCNYTLVEISVVVLYVATYPGSFIGMKGTTSSNDIMIITCIDLICLNHVTKAPISRFTYYNPYHFNWIFCAGLVLGQCQEYASVPKSIEFKIIIKLIKKVSFESLKISLKIVFCAVNF